MWYLRYTYPKSVEIYFMAWNVVNFHKLCVLEKNVYSQVVGCIVSSFLYCSDFYNITDFFVVAA